MTRSLLLADVDGTLVDTRGSLWPEVRSLIKAAEASDWTIALCSARPAWSIRSLSEQLGVAVHYAVSFQGAMVSRREAFQSTESGSNWRTIRSCVIDSAVVSSIESLIRRDDSLWWYTETDWYVRSVDEAAKLESQVIHATWTDVGHYHDHGHLLKILVVRVKHPERLLAELAAASLPIVCSISQPGYIEIVSDVVGRDKGAALLQNLERRGDSLPHIVAIGDGRNDLGMFSVADIAVTFEDSSFEVRAAADVILPRDRNVAFKQLSNQLMGNLL